jgi:EamA domain-containing membrane protein RarD
VTFVIYQHPGSVSLLGWFFEALAIAAFVFEAYAFIDATRRPAQAFVAASKQTKPLWLVITGVATVIGLGTAATGSLPIGILAVVAFVG